MILFSNIVLFQSDVLVNGIWIYPHIILYVIVRIPPKYHIIIINNVVI